MQPNTTIGVIAGNGELPALVVQESLDRGLLPCVVTFNTNHEKFKPAEGVPILEISIGQVGKAVRFFKEHDVETLIFVGGITRPALSKVKTDLKGGVLLSQLLLKKNLGDDSLLTTIIAFLEKEGFEVMGVDSVAESLVMPEGLLGKVKPNAQDRKDIAFGLSIAQEMGRLDIGQSVIVQQAQVLGVEAIEGTDRLIERCGDYRRGESGGILVKVCKPGQDRRIDLPTIGVDTVISLSDKWFKGIALQAKNALIVDKDRVIKEADQRGIFIIGV